MIYEALEMSVVNQQVPRLGSSVIHDATTYISSMMSTPTKDIISMPPKAPKLVPPPSASPPMEAGQASCSRRPRLSAKFEAAFSQNKNHVHHEDLPQEPEIAGVQETQVPTAQPAQHAQVDTMEASDGESTDSSDSFKGQQDSEESDSSLTTTQKRPATRAPAQRTSKRAKRSSKNKATPAEESLQGLAPMVPPAQLDGTPEPQPAYGSLLHQGCGERQTTGSPLWQYVYPLATAKAPVQVAITAAVLTRRPKGPGTDFLGCHICDQPTDRNSQVL